MKVEASFLRVFSILKRKQNILYGEMVKTVCLPSRIKPVCL